MFVNKVLPVGFAGIDALRDCTGELDIFRVKIAMHALCSRLAYRVNISATLVACSLALIQTPSG